MDLLPGYEFIDALGDGASWVPDQSPYRIVLHTTEGSSIEGAVSVYQRQYASPHLTVDPWSGRKAQHLPLDVAAYALENRAGGVETNRQHTVQVEIVGFAAESQDWPDPALAFIASVINDIRTQVNIPLTAPAFVGTEAGWIARPDAPQRFSFEQWIVFSGVCGHQHVPENSHWDPGRLNIARVLELAANTPGVDDMTRDDLIGVLRAPEFNVAAIREAGDRIERYVQALTAKVDDLEAKVNALQQAHSGAAPTGDVNVTGTLRFS